MARSRYMVVEHNRDSEALGLAHGKITGQLPIHQHLLSYHWTRLNDTHVLVLGAYGFSSYNDIADHPKVALFPLHTSHKKLAHHFESKGKMSHFNAIASALSLSVDATTADLLDAIEEHLGPVMHPSK